MENLAVKDLLNETELQGAIENLSGNVDSLYLTALRRCIAEDSQVIKRFHSVMKIILSSRVPMTEDQITKVLGWRAGTVGTTLLQVC